MSTLMSQLPTNMPTELISLLLHLPEEYTRKFSDLFNIMPQELSSQFSNHLTSSLTLVRTALPSALATPPPENLALFPDFPALHTKFINTLIINMCTMITTVTLTIPSRWLGDACSKFLTVLNFSLYVNAPSNLPDLINSLQDVLADYSAAQPYIAHTSFPSELFPLLNDSLPSDLHLLSRELNDFFEELVCDMLWDFIIILQELNEELRDELYDSPAAPDYQLENAAPDYQLEALTVQYVYQARGVADPDNCLVCLEEMKDGDNARRLRCLHAFHKDCIDRWLERTEACPMCRTYINAIPRPACP